MADSKILISWIIIGRDWGDNLKQLVNSLNVQSFDSKLIELIIIDDASSNNPINDLQNIEFKNKKIIILDNHSGRCGAQNAGIQKAQGKYCIFTQSNTIPEKDFLEKYINYLSNLNGDGAAGIINYTCRNDAFETYLNHSSVLLLSL